MNYKELKEKVEKQKLEGDAFNHKCEAAIAQIEATVTRIDKLGQQGLLG